MTRKESEETVRRYGQQHESSTLTSELAWIGGQYERFNRKGKKEPTQGMQKDERELSLIHISEPTRPY